MTLMMPDHTTIKVGDKVKGWVYLYGELKEVEGEVTELSDGPWGYGGCAVALTVDGIYIPCCNATLIEDE